MISGNRFEHVANASRTVDSALNDSALAGGAANDSALAGGAAGRGGGQGEVT